MNKLIKPENRKHGDFEEFFNESLKNPKIKAEYNKLQPDFAIIRAVIDARVHKGLTQNVLAKKIGTKQSVISRLESGHANPSIAFLKKFAKALNTHLEIKFVPS